MVVEFFEVVVGGFRWLKVVPSFSNYGRRLLYDLALFLCQNHSTKSDVTSG